MDTWPEWNADTEWVRLDGPSRRIDGRTEAQGAQGQVRDRRLVLKGSSWTCRAICAAHLRSRRQPAAERGCAIDIAVTIEATALAVESYPRRRFKQSAQPTWSLVAVAEAHRCSRPRADVAARGHMCANDRTRARQRTSICEESTGCCCGSHQPLAALSARACALPAHPRAVRAARLPRLAAERAARHAAPARNHAARPHDDLTGAARPAAKS